MRDEFKSLEEAIKDKCGRSKIYYLPNNGNWGDALIRHGTLKFFDDINLNYKELDVDGCKKLKKRNRTPLFSKRNTLIYGGGGAWCKLWDFSKRITKLQKRFNHVIVLPSTYELPYSIPNTSFFRRDMFESKENMPNAPFCHDMAFYIGKHFFQNIDSHGKGYFFRSDKESANRIKIPSCNVDISAKGNHLSDVSPFFEEINRYAVIHTDRLHVAIAACLLEKETHVYPGSYFKNLALYKSSMAGHYENIFFHEEFNSY
ncbi:MAG: hypothetical protein HRU15_13840 [Planctomycetes bacterium]|nr:hypothetical protein [Planctomycetota bacterium]